MALTAKITMRRDRRGQVAAVAVASFCSSLMQQQADASLRLEWLPVAQGCVAGNEGRGRYALDGRRGEEIRVADQRDLETKYTQDFVPANPHCAT